MAYKCTAGWHDGSSPRNCNAVTEVRAWPSLCCPADPFQRSTNFPCDGILFLEQVNVFDLSQAAPDPTVIDLSAAGQFQANVVRIVSTDGAAVTLLVGGADTSYDAQYLGVVLYGSVAAGSTAFNMTGSVNLQSVSTGVTELSQTSLLQRGYILASTDDGVFKCATASEMCTSACLAARMLESV